MPYGISSALAVRQVVFTADPAANAEFTASPPAGKTWVLYSVSVLLVQGGTQTPQPILTIDDGTSVLYESFGSSTAQVVSSTARYTWAADLTLVGPIGTTPNIHNLAPLPTGGYPVPPGGRVRSVTLGIGANTDYGVAALQLVEFG